MAKWAVIDVDGTLLPKTSMEKLFIINALKNKIIPKTNVFYFILNIFVKIGNVNFTYSLKGNKTYLKNLSADKIQFWGSQFVENIIWEKISKSGLKKIKQLKSSGYKILIMSGSPDFLILPLAKKIEHDSIIATTLEINNNKFTGKIKGIHPYGNLKTQLLLHLKKDLLISFDESSVFANHHDDVDHMALFSHIVAVNPTKKLLHIAKEKKWKIEWWD